MDRPNQEFLYNIIKIEIEEDGTENKSLANSDSHPDEAFLSTSVSSDPLSGHSICLLCLEEMEHQQVATHMVDVHRYRRISMKCFNCGQFFPDRNLLQLHKQNCQPTKPQKLTLQQLLKSADEQYNEKDCPICLTELQEDLKEHLDKYHAKKPQQPQGPANCTVCGKTFKNKATMAEHVKLVHKAKGASFSCDHCSQTFATKKYLANHVRNVHPPDGKEHRCEFCKKRYKSHQVLYQHVKYVHHVKMGSSTEYP